MLLSGEHFDLTHNYMEDQQISMQVYIAQCGTEWSSKLLYISPIQIRMGKEKKGCNRKDPALQKWQSSISLGGFAKTILCRTH